MLLEVRQVKKNFVYRKSGKLLCAVNGVSLGVEEGELLGLVGESGCGKSTLANIFLGLEEVDSGGVYWNGESLEALSKQGKRLERRNIQAVFQQASTALNPRMKVRDLIAEPLKNYHEPYTNDMIEQLLFEVELSPNLKNRHPHALSDGQKQRVAIARALALRPRCIVFDEATSSLDALTSLHILELIKKLNKEKGIGGLFISHDIEAVMYICKRVAVMYQGKIIEILEGGEWHKAKEPYTQMLLGYGA